MGTWVVEMQAMLGNPEQLGMTKTSIYKVPPFISNINKTPYLPRVVSFGPYHHGEPQLASMEAHKQRALIRCINRSGLPIQKVFDFVAKVAEELKDSYDSLDPKWQDDIERFVQLMILDGCFMLELLRVAYKSENYYSDDDPIFSQHGDLYVVPFVKADMLMLENQLPMLLLLSLKHILENEPDVEKLNADILWLLHYDIYPNMGKCLHVLDLYRKSLLRTHNEHRNVASQSSDQRAPQSPNQGEGKNKRVSHNVIRPATELHNAGVHFMKSESKSLRDITFDNGIFKLPNFIVDGYTELMFLNLIAFEHCHIPAGSDITSFVTFMDCIINDSRDIKLLCSKGIVDNFIGSDKEVADLFNTMSKDLIMEMTGNLNQVYKNLIDYCDMPWHNCLSKLTDKSCERELVNEEMGSWVVEMQAGLDDNGSSQEEQSRRMKTSIYKVPPFISNINERAYQPRVVSFGPYHHGEPHLASMDNYKQRALHSYISKSNRPVQDVFNSVAEVAEKLKDSYDSLDSKWQDNTERFVQLMILDGCFMLELIKQTYYSDDDPLFSDHGFLYIMPFIMDDMLLLENQLPMLLLLTLKRILDNDEHNIENLNAHIENLNARILFCLGYDTTDDNYPNMGECLHVLDLYRKRLLHRDNKPKDEAPQFPIQGEKNGKRVGHNVVRPATELQEAGVRFKKSKSKSLQDITFNDGVLKLPNFIVDDYTESMFLNLIAFERCHILAGSDITSFVTFMDCIIDDGRDIKLLSSKGIMDNHIGSDKEAADLFNTLAKDLGMGMNDNLNKVYEKLIDYSNTDCNKWRANLIQTYFRSPWTFISVIAAFLLFSLTAVQTIFTIPN